MSWYRVVAVNEETRPLAGITIEAFDLSARAVVASVVTNRAGEALFTGLTGPQFFRPRNRRTSGTMGNKTFTGRIVIQVVGMDALCFDFVVDPDGGGTDATLAAAIASAITAGGTQTIWLCGSVSEATIDIGGLGSSARIHIYSPDRTAVTITAATNSDIFEQTSTGGNTAGAMEFHNVGFSIPSTDKAILSIETGSEVRNVIFDRCQFDNQYLLRQTGTVSLGALHLQVRYCVGDLAGFYDVAGTATNLSPDRLTALNNQLTLDNWWDGGANNRAPGSTRVQGGLYVLGTSSGITFDSTAEQQHFQDLIIHYGGSGDLFTTASGSAQLEDLSFQNIVIRFDDEDGTFGDFGSSNINVNNGLYIKNIFGFPNGGVSPTGTFLTVDSDWTNVHIGNLLAKGFGTTYSGPSGVGDDHGLMSGLLDDDHTIHPLLAGRSGGQTLIGGTVSGEDLTLQSTSNATRGSIFLGSSSQFELAETTGRLSLPTAGASAGLLLGTEVLLARIGSNTLAVQPAVGTTLMTLNSTPILAIGVDDTTRGLVDMYGHATGQDVGGRFRTYMSADYDSTDQFWIAGVNQDDFLINLENTSIFALTHEGQLQLAVAGSAAGIRIGGDAQIYRSGANVLATTDAFAISGGITTSTIDEIVSEAGVTVEDALLRDGQVWGVYPGLPEIGFGEQTVATLAGNELTDITRGLATQGDGRDVPDSSFGIWEATTNLIANGGMESNTTGWATRGGGGSPSVARDTSFFKFGAASLKCVSGTSTFGGLDSPTATVSAGTQITVSFWMYRTEGSVPFALFVRDESGNLIETSGALPTTTERWFRFEFTTTTLTGDTGAIARITKNNDATNVDFYIDGLQIETQPVATPYVETDGGTASRSAARVRIPIDLDETAGWLAIRLRAGWLSTGDPSSNPVVWQWRDDDSNMFELRYDTANNQWDFERINGGSAGEVTVSDTFSKDDFLTLIARWDSANLLLSVDGATFTTASAANVPTLTATTIDVGSHIGSSEHIDSDVLWLVGGKGTLNNTEAKGIAALGNRPPQRIDLPSAAVPTFGWDANSGALLPDILLQEPDRFSVDYQAGQLSLPIAGSGAGLLIGGDTQWYRSAANVMRTPDSLTVDGDLLAHKPLTTKTGTYTITASDEVVIADAASASFTITLPAAASNSGKVYWIKKVDSTANTVTVDGNGSETIDGGTTAVLTCQYEAITIISDGTEWWII